MSSYLGFRSKEGTTGVDNPFFAGGWVVSFTPDDIGVQERVFEISHIAVQGPADPASNLQVWLDTIFYSATVRGDINDYDPNQPIPVRSGQTVNFYWDTVTNPAPTVTIFLQQPDLI